MTASEAEADRSGSNSLDANMTVQARVAAVNDDASPQTARAAQGKESARLTGEIPDSEDEEDSDSSIGPPADDRRKDTAPVNVATPSLTSPDASRDVTNTVSGEIASAATFNSASVDVFQGVTNTVSGEISSAASPNSASTDVVQGVKNTVNVSNEDVNSQIGKAPAPIDPSPSCTAPANASSETNREIPDSEEDEDEDSDVDASPSAKADSALGNSAMQSITSISASRDDQDTTNNLSLNEKADSKESPAPTEPLAPSKQAANESSEQHDQPQNADTASSRPAKSSTVSSQPTKSNRITTLEATLSDLQTQRQTLMRDLSSHPGLSEHLSHDNHSSDTPDEEATLKAANAIIKRHIKLLHDYNDIKDVGLGLMGLIADARGVRIRDVQEDFGVDAKD